MEKNFKTICAFILAACVIGSVMFGFYACGELSELVDTLKDVPASDTVPDTSLSDTAEGTDFIDTEVSYE